MAAVAVLLAVTAPGAAEGAAYGPAVPSPARHETRLASAAQHGEAALRTLGDDVGIAAQRSGLTTARLRHLLRTDPTAWLDPRGHVFFREPAPTAPLAGQGDAVKTAAYPYAQTFQLHSRPGSTRTIYLNFTGGDVSGTAWGPSIGVVPPFSLDSSSGWSSSEQDLVQAVWARVSALYAPFDVDVTTENPGNAALAYAGPGDPAYGTMAMITNNAATAQAVCSGCGGLAYLGVFDWEDTSGGIPFYEPAFVLGSRLGNSVAGIADAAAHEVGHNVGLSHDGRNNSYDEGVGGWGPVMGAPYSMGLLQFSDGDYPGATNTEDDYAVAASHGVPLVADDLPDTPADATPMAVGSGRDTASGLISTRADRDDVSFTTGCTGSVQLDLVPTGDHPALDTSVRLLSPDGSEQLGSADPPMVGHGAFPTASATGLDAHLTRTLGPGTYVVQVDGTGFSNATTSYSDYGSRGGWSLSVTGCVITPGTVVVPPGTLSAPRSVAVSEDATLPGAMDVTWEPPADLNGHPAPTEYRVALTSGTTTTAYDVRSATRLTVSGLTADEAYAVTVTAVDELGGAGVTSAPVTFTYRSVRTTTTVPPAHPRIHHAQSGTAGRRPTATARWAAPLRDGGSPVLRYRITALRLDDAGHVLHRRHFSAAAGLDVRRMRLHRGHWVFRVAALNAIGRGHLSPRSNEVVSR